MTWILKACVGYFAAIGTCGHYINQPYEHRSHCIQAAEMLLSRPKVEWAICHPEEKK